VAGGEFAAHQLELISQPADVVVQVQDGVAGLDNDDFHAAVILVPMRCHVDRTEGTYHVDQELPRRSRAVVQSGYESACFPRL
jgi:hypothetical protein